MRKMCSKTACLLSAFLLLGYLGAGCGGGGTTDPCEGIANACVNEGANRCNAAGDGLQTCEKDDDGCLVWTDSIPCGERQVCQTSGADAECRCNSECQTSGETRCKPTDTTVIQTCTADGDGCLYWADGIDCADEDKYCDDTGDTAVCSETCVDQCTQGETQCNGTIIQGCTYVGDCLDWVDGTDCADTDRICSDASGDAACYDECIDECDTIDATQCSGEIVQTCELGEDGCNDWVDTTDCSDDGEFCVIEAGDATCSSSCEDRCDTEDATQCGGPDGQTVQTCEEVASGCLDWVDGNTCTPPRFECEVVGGDAQCVEQCSDDCDPDVDASQCAGTVRQECQMNDDTGCYEWVDLEDCADNEEFCDDTVDPVVCVGECTDECSTLDETRCSTDGSAVEVCEEGGDGCNDWVVQSDCSENSQVCYDSPTGAPKCVDPCEDECDTVDATQCDDGGTIVQTCELNENDGCNDWVDTENCSGNTPVCDVVDGDAMCVCVDECDTLNATQCDDSGTIVQTCVADGDADACLEWDDTTVCDDPTPACDIVDNTAQCVCVDECSAGDSQCDDSGLWVQDCVTDGDDDACYEFANATDCSDGGASTDVCDIVGSDAQCVCSDECPALNDTQCDDSNVWIQTCVTDADGDACLEWQDTTDCTAEDPPAVCEDAGGTASCESTCTDECDTLGATQCSTDGTDPTVEECQEGGDGCNDWVVIDTCVDDTPVCDDSGDPAVCACVDECDTLGGVCNGNVPENCVEGGDGCNDLIIGEDCDPDQCVIDGDGAAVCQAPCGEIIVQPIDTEGSAFACQDFETANDVADIFIGDDFTVSDPTTVDMFFIPGGLWNGSNLSLLNADSLHFEIWADAGGEPDGVPFVDAPYWELTVPPTDPQVYVHDATGSGYLDSVFLTPDSPPNLTAGTWWIVFYPSLNFGAGYGQFGWHNSTTSNFDIAKVINPGEGIGPWTVWTNITDAFEITTQDMAFSLWSGPECCFNKCSTEGATVCNGETGNEIWTCTMQTNGCLDWEMTSACTDPTPYCDDSSGNAVCVGPLCPDGIDLGTDTGSPVIQGDTTGQGDDFLGSCTQGSGGEDVCYNWQVPQDGIYIIDTENSTGMTDTVLYMYLGATEVACSDDDGTGLLSSLLVVLEAGMEFVIVVDGYSSSSAGLFDLNIELVPNESVCDDWTDNDYDQLPDCSDPTDCQTMAICDPGAGAVGTACTSHNDCSATADDPACWTDAEGFGNGYCSEWCSADDECPAGGICLDVGFASIGACFDLCDLASPDCRADEWVDPDSGDDCAYVCTDIGEGTGVCLPQCIATLTVDGGWKEGELTSGDDEAVYFFTGTAGTTYYVWWDDYYEGSSTYTGDLEVSAYQEDQSTAYFEDVDSGYNTSQPVQIVAGESEVMVVAHPWNYYSSSAGTFAIAVTSTNTQP